MSKLTRSSSLNFRDVLLLQPELLVDTDDILPNRQRGHPVGIVRHSSKKRSALASGERLPPSFCTAVAGVHCHRNRQFGASSNIMRTHMQPSPSFQRYPLIDYISNHIEIGAIILTIRAEE